MPRKRRGDTLSAEQAWLLMVGNSRLQKKLFHLGEKICQNIQYFRLNWSNIWFLGDKIWSQLSNKLLPERKITTTECLSYYIL